jgi:hypothetical protein
MKTYTILLIFLILLTSVLAASGATVTTVAIEVNSTERVSCHAQNLSDDPVEVFVKVKDGGGVTINSHQFILGPGIASVIVSAPNGQKAYCKFQFHAKKKLVRGYATKFETVPVPETELIIEAH